MTRILSILLLFFLAACGDKPPITPSQPNIFAVTSFPMSIGKKWNYLRVNRVTGTEVKDTVSVKVVSDSADSQGNQYFWITYTAHSQIIDSQYVHYTADSLTFFTKEGQLADKFKMPFNDSLSWKGWNIHDNYAIGYFNVSTTAYNITHDSTVSVNRNYAVATNHQISKKFNFKKNKGIVHIYSYEFLGTLKQKDETWVLIDN